MEIIDLPPIAPTLIESTRAIGYSLQAAIADIIDNSIAAQATEVEISFFPLDGAFVSILDNGSGMSSDELTNAMQYGSQNPMNTRGAGDLGRFGLGLKTASLSQCRKLTVASKKNGSIGVRCWDIDYVQKTGKWSLISLEDSNEIKGIPSIERLRKLESGTLVVWQELDRMKAGCIDFEKSMGRQIDEVRDHLSLVYHRYLAGETGIQKLKITINGTPIEPADPFLIKKSDQTMQEEVYLIHGEKIRVQPYILPHVSKMTAKELKEVGGQDGLQKLQGFYVYRNKRLLVWGTWFRMMRKGELSKLARIRVDIPNTLDDLWTLDIKKSYAMPPEEVRANLANVIENIGNKSKVKFTKRGKKEVDDKEVHLWNRMRDHDGGYFYEINREHPLIQQLSNQLGSEKGMLDTVLTQIEKSIPLNQIYIDFNGDERITNDQQQKDKEIEASLRNMLAEGMTEEQKLQFLEQLSYISPFREYPRSVEKVKKEVMENGKEQ
jgi:hypothetical protein